MRRLRRHQGKWAEAILAAESGKKVHQRGAIALESHGLPKAKPVRSTTAQRLPPREYEYRSVPESLQDSLRSALPDIGLLILINILLFITAHLFFLRYEV